MTIVYERDLAGRLWVRVLEGGQQVVVEVFEDGESAEQVLAWLVDVWAETDWKDWNEDDSDTAEGERGLQ